MFLNLLILAVILFLLLILSMVWPPDSPWSPWWRTDEEKIRKALKLAKTKSRDIVFDLGAGDGKVLIIGAKEFGAKGVGIEIDPLRSFISKVLVRYYGLSGKVKIIRGNFFKEDLASATIVFLYLVPKALAKLKPKLLRELKKGTKIITIKYEIDLSKIAEDKKLGISLYRI